MKNLHQERGHTSDKKEYPDKYNYMYKIWSKEECEIVFGDMSQHFWSKWLGIFRTKPIEEAIKCFCGELTSHNWAKIVNRMKQISDISDKLYILVSNEYCEVEDIEKILKGDKETYTNLLIADKIELYLLSEFIEAFNSEKINTAVHTIYLMSSDIREKLRLK